MGAGASTQKKGAVKTALVASRFKALSGTTTNKEKSGHAPAPSGAALAALLRLMPKKLTTPPSTTKTVGDVLVLDDAHPLARQALELLRPQLPQVDHVVVSSTVSDESSVRALEPVLASARAVVVLLSDGCLESPAVIFAMRCAVAYSTPCVLVHVAETCGFDRVLPRAEHLSDLFVLYDKLAVPMVCEYANVAAGKIGAEVDDQLEAMAEEERAASSRSDEDMVRLQREAFESMREQLLSSAPPLLAKFDVAFRLFLSHKQSTAQGQVGRIYQELHGLSRSTRRYSCFLDTEAKFKLHNLRVLVMHCNSFLLFLSADLLEASAFCLEELLTAMYYEKEIIAAPVLSYKLPDDVAATVTPVLRRIGEGPLKRFYGHDSVKSAADAVAAAVTAAWRTRITYHAEHFHVFIERLCRRLGPPDDSELLRVACAEDEDVVKSMKRHARGKAGGGGDDSIRVGYGTIDFRGLAPLTRLNLRGKMRGQITHADDFHGIFRPPAPSSSSSTTTTVREVNLGGNGMRLVGARALAAALTPEPNRSGLYENHPNPLESLSLTANQMSRKCMSALAEAFAPRKQPNGEWHLPVPVMRLSVDNSSNAASVLPVEIPIAGLRSGTVREFDVGGYDVDEGFAHLLGAVLDHNPIRRLSFGGCHNVTVQGVARLLRAVKTWWPRRGGEDNEDEEELGGGEMEGGPGVGAVAAEPLALNMHGVALNRTDGTEVVEHLSSLMETCGGDALKSLDLSQNRLGDAAVKRLMKSLAAAATAGDCALEALDLSENGLTNAGAKALEEAMKTLLPRLQTLNVAGNPLSAESAKRLARAALARHLELFNRLPVAALRGRGGGAVSQDSAAGVSPSSPSALAAKDDPTRLDLSRRGIGVAGAMALALLVRERAIGFRGFKILDVTRNGIGEHGAIALLEAFESLGGDADDAGEEEEGGGGGGGDDDGTTITVVDVRFNSYSSTKQSAIKRFEERVEAYENGPSSVVFWFTMDDAAEPNVDDPD